MSVFKDHVPIICKQWYFVVRIVLHFDVIIFSLIKIIFVLIIYNLRIHKQAFELIVITSFKFQYCLVQYNLWLSVFISSSQSVCLWTINCKHFAVKSYVSSWISRMLFKWIKVKVLKVRDFIWYRQKIKISPCVFVKLIRKSQWRLINF